MKPLLSVLVLCIAAGWPMAAGWADSPRGSRPTGQTTAFQPVGFAQVVATAYAFMGPRTLDPIPFWQLTQWGLQGVTGLDPRFMVEVHGADSKSAGLRLLLIASPGTPNPAVPKLLAAHPAPANDDPTGWGHASADMVRAIWDQSDLLRRVGGGFITGTFFDEMFGHIDPFSRYANPAEAASERAQRNGRAGVGLGFTVRGGAFVVTEVQLGGPARGASELPGSGIANHAESG